MQESTFIPQAIQQLLHQLPVLLATIVGFVLLIRHQNSLGTAKTPALIGLLAIIALTLVGPLYQAWIHKLVLTQGAGANTSLIVVSSIILNILWGISVLLLILSIFMGRKPSPSEG